MSDPVPRFVSCPCQHCSGKIEFDADKLDITGEAGSSLPGQTIACPHCGLETILFISPSSKQVPPPAFPPARMELSGRHIQKSKSDSQSAVLLNIASVILFLIGLGLAFQGCSGEFDESLRHEDSAIRQNVYAVQYGSGFIVLALSVIVGAMVRLIQKP